MGRLRLIRGSTPSGQRARSAAEQIRRARNELPDMELRPVVDDAGGITGLDTSAVIAMLNDAHADLGTLKQEPTPHRLARLGVDVDEE